MLAPLTVLFVVVPFVELFVILRVGGAIGVGPTVGTLIAVSVLGAWLVKREGFAVLRRATGQIQAGRVPGRELVDGVLILFGGALLLTPGFLTDLFGLALLFPPVRAVVRPALLRQLTARVRMRRF